MEEDVIQGVSHLCSWSKAEAAKMSSARTGRDRRSAEGPVGWLEKGNH